MVVPGRGFLLNNELTDFNFTPTQGTAKDPNLPAPGKRPRSSMAPTILLSHGKPFLATGSPGGSTIITTVFQILLNRIDFDMTLPEAVAAAARQPAQHGNGSGRARVPGVAGGGRVDGRWAMCSRPPRRSGRRPAWSSCPTDRWSRWRSRSAGAAVQRRSSGRRDSGTVGSASEV